MNIPNVFKRSLAAVWKSMDYGVRLEPWKLVGSPWKSLTDVWDWSSREGWMRLDFGCLEIHRTC